MTSRVTLLDLVTEPFAGGLAFGDTGAYERVRGRIRIEVDPGHEANRAVVDLEHAPRNADGLVECTADLLVLRPVDLDRGNRRLLFDYGNRGNARALQFFNDAAPSNDPRDPDHAGNGFLMRRGYTVAWCAWQGDLLPGDGRMLLDLPVATRDGEPITGAVRVEFITDRSGVHTLPLSGRASTRSHPAASLDTRAAELTRRRYPGDERVAVDPAAWRFARVESGAGLDAQGAETALVPSDTHIHLPQGFEPGWIYELVYTGRDPLVLGLGHAVVRDTIGFLRYESRDAAGNENPAGGAAHVERAYAWGRSQTGRCIRDALYLGFNADPQGRRVFDGVLPHVAGAGRMWLNHRFANAITPAGQQYEDHYNRADCFPFSYASCTDHVSGRTDAILKRPDTDPLVIHTQTSTEYWQRRGSLVHTDTRGNDLEQPPGVRVYLWSSSQHFASPRLGAPGRGVCHHPANVVQTSMLFRAVLDAMDAWASGRGAPPASRVPSRADGTLVDYDEWRTHFPAIPAAAVPQSPSWLPDLDFGPDEPRGVLREPPVVRDERAYAVLVPSVDADGNEVAGVRAPMVQAPLATYCGWNVRRREFGAGATHEFTGSTIAFPDTPQERAATGDPRRSVLERYPTPEAYRDAIERAARGLVEDGLMLEEDVERAVHLAADWGRPRHAVRL